MRLVKLTNASGRGDASHSKIFPVDNNRSSIAKYKKGKTKKLSCHLEEKKKETGKLLQTRNNKLF